MAPIFSIFKKNEMMFTSEVVRLPAQSIKLINQPTRADFVDLSANSDYFCRIISNTGKKSFIYWRRQFASCAVVHRPVCILPTKFSELLKQNTIARLA
jgi:hypothetical protein